MLSSDIAKLSKAPGIGKKTAEKIVVELRDKFGKEDGVRPITAEISGSAALSASDPRQDTALALIELGFPSSEAYKAVRELDPNETDTGVLLKQALNLLGR